MFKPNMIISIDMTRMMKWCSRVPNGIPRAAPIRVNRKISLKMYMLISCSLKPKTFKVAISRIRSEMLTWVRLNRTTKAKEPATRMTMPIMRFKA